MRGQILLNLRSSAFICGPGLFPPCLSDSVVGVLFHPSLLARQCRAGQSICSGITERSMECVRRRGLGEPLHQRLSLRVEGELQVVWPGAAVLIIDAQSHREGRMGQHLHRITGFQIALAHAGFTGELPAWRDVVDEGIIERFRDFMAHGQHVQDVSIQECPGRSPACVGSNPAGLRSD